MRQPVPKVIFALLLGLIVTSLSAPAAAKTLKLVAIGDSLVAGLGLPANQAFTGVLEQRLKAKGHDVVVVNAGVSGDTAADGLARLDWALGDGADAVILELGANDMLRGLDPKATRRTLDQIVKVIADKKLPLLISGMRASGNLGPDYVTAFDAIYPDLAARYGALIDPFYLDGVAMDPKLNQDDGIHPNAKGVIAIVGRMLPLVEELLAKVGS